MSKPKQRRIAIFGAKSVGKSSLIAKFLDGDEYTDIVDDPTENTFRKNIKIEGEDYELILSESSVQIAHGNLCTDALVLIYSVASSESFKIIKNIHSKLLVNEDNIRLPVFLIGNKIDLHSTREVTVDEGFELSKLMNCHFSEISLKESDHTAVNVFTKIIIQIDNLLSTEKRFYYVERQIDFIKADVRFIKNELVEMKKLVKVVAQSVESIKSAICSKSVVLPVVSPPPKRKRTEAPGLRTIENMRNLI